MGKLLIAESSDTLRIQLQEELKKHYDVTTCADGAAALRLLDSLRPDALILDLMLPESDGLSVLELAEYIPSVVLCITALPSEYAIQRACDLGAGYILLKPCSIRSIANHLEQLCIAHSLPRRSLPDAQSRAAAHLLALGVNLSSAGGYQLRVGIPLFAQDPSQRLGKELYPAITVLCGNTAQDVEYTMRDAIQKAWTNRDQELWEWYFPGATRYPSNKRFISRLAQIILDENA